MASWMGRTSLELIGQGGMGYSFDPLVTDVKDAYAEALKSLLQVSSTFPLSDSLTNLVKSYC